MRVFISSTVFDLIDVRAEVAELLRELGIAPVLSDDKLSDFDFKVSANSIETCLINVDSSDEVIVILDKRYGPRLGEFGFDDVSATHLEYRRAVERKKPTYVFVRDRLEADYGTWKKNERDDSIRLSWIGNKDHGLLTFLDEHKRLVAKSDVSNWFSTFTSSTDLKSALRKHLTKRVLPSRLVYAIQKNEFPLFDIQVKAEQMTVSGVTSLTFRVTLKNVGGAPAFNFRVYWVEQENEDEHQRIVAPETVVKMTFLYGLTGDLTSPTRILIAEYTSPLGVSVKDTFSVDGRVIPGPIPALISAGRQIDRKFRYADEVTLDIEEE